MVLRRERQNIAFAGHGLRLEEQRRDIIPGSIWLVLLLLLLNGAIVIGEDERVLVLRIRISLRPLIAGAEVALVTGQRSA